MGGMRYLGIDYGTKHIGIAVSDEAGTMGFPHATLSRTPSVSKDITLLCEKEGIGHIVIGESLQSDGTPNKLMEEIREFAGELRRYTGLPVSFEPEMYSSQEARRAPSGERDHRARVDAQAAALILTSFLSHHGNTR